MTPPPGEPDGGRPGAEAPTRRYLAGVPLGFALTDERRAALRARGAEVVAYSARLGVLTLEVAGAGAAFAPPDFVLFVEPDGAVGPAGVR